VTVGHRSALKLDTTSLGNAVRRLREGLIRCESEPTDEQIRENIYKVIDDLEIPAKREDIKVDHTHSGLTISVSYAVPVDFYVYKTDLNFTPSSAAVDIMK